MMLTWIVILFHITHSFYNNHGEEQTMLFKSTSHYDFKSFPTVGSVVVWSISPASSKTISEPEVYANRMPRLQTNKTYLIFTQTVPLKFLMYYWVGCMAPLKNKKLAAKYAWQQYILFQEYLEGIGIALDLKISREEECIETESFWNTINFINKINANEKFRHQYTYVDTYVPAKFPALYMIKGTNITARFKKVPFSTQWLKNDICLLLETGYILEDWNPVITYCGPNTSTVVREETKEYKRIWEGYYGHVEQNAQVFINRDALMFKAFLELLEDNNNLNPCEIDDSHDHLKSGDEFVASRDNAVRIYKISQNGLHRILQEEHEIFSTHNVCHIYDSASMSGIVFFVPYEAEQEVKLKAVEMVEDYIHNNYSLASRPVHMRITEILQPFAI